MWRLMWLTLSFVVCYLSAVNRGDAAPLDSADKATGYLERFGYLERVGPQDSSYAESVSAESSKQLFDAAIKDFQSFVGLNKTGILDNATLELMNKPRCGVPDRVRPGSSSSTRRKRFVIEGSHWSKKKLTYKIKKYTPDMPKSDVDSEIARAFQMWADVTDLSFVHVNNPWAAVDIDILFASGEHGDCKPFDDGPGGIQAHAAFPINGGDAHFDEGETWTLDSKGANLFQVATHEFGHSLGLDHTDKVKAVMHPIYKNRLSQPTRTPDRPTLPYSSDFKLDEDDIEGIQELYGKNQFSRKLALELEATLELLKTTVNELRNELIDTRTNLNTKLEETRQELVKTRADFTITVDDLSARLNATKKEFAETIGKMSTELRKCGANSTRLGKELRIAEENLKKDLRATSNDLETAKTNLVSTTTELNSTKSAVAELATKLIARTREIVDIGKMPTSCADLQRMGHKLSGFFLVKGSKKMEMIYCDFYPNQNDLQKWIGYADVKSAPVHFYVTRTSPFNTESTPIRFDLARVNEGNAMNLTSGKFTAPRPGIYFFSFTGVAYLQDSPPAWFYSHLYLNGSPIGRSFVKENKYPVDQFSPVTLQSTLNLKKGDQVWVTIGYDGSASSLHDSSSHYTHFTGFMLEEEIVASL